ncbi:unnamed protein product [Durusdinium trenchii]|uniref:Uncharacterized protein n=1 Tax=Durusdinium trenchii TaxID=1381693 RepID=A0ABP0IFT7_9DINO
MHPGWGGRPGYDPRLSGFMVPPIPPVPGIPVAPPSIAAPIPVMLPSPPGVPLAATPTVVPPSFTATGRSRPPLRRSMRLKDVLRRREATWRRPALESEIKRREEASLV